MICTNMGSFQLYPPKKIIAPHCGIFTMIGGGAIGYLITKLGGGGYNNKDPKYELHVKLCHSYQMSNLN